MTRQTRTNMTEKTEQFVDTAGTQGSLQAMNLILAKLLEEFVLNHNISIRVFKDPTLIKKGA
jgi:hypothetical protein